MDDKILRIIKIYKNSIYAYNWRGYGIKKKDIFEIA